MAASGLTNIGLRLLMALVLALAVVVPLKYLIGDRLLVTEAASVALLLKLSGLHFLRIRDTIYVPVNNGVVGFRIEWHCSGIVTSILYLTILLIVPMKRTRRLIMLLAGIPIIYLVNVARIALVIIVARHASLDTATMVHTVLGPILLLGTVALLAFSGLREELSKKPRS